MQRIIASVTLLFSLSAFAQIESLIQFKGQNAETINLAKLVTVTRPEAYEANTTCTRQVPREVYECNDVTRYRNECSRIPEAQNCWNENENVCRSVTRTREECSNGPSRRICVERPTREVCTERPSRQECTPVTRTRQECSDGPSREECTERPSREVCVERPTREVCRTRADGTQSCQTVGGGQSCQTVGGGQSCRTVNGPRSCRDVSYTEQSCRTVGGGQSCQTVGGGQSCHDEEGPRSCRSVNYPDQECTTVSHQRCETIPAHDECHDIPYSEQVCGNVTRYDDENYACTETRYRDVKDEKKLSGIMNVVFLTNGLVDEFPLTVGITPSSPEMKAFETVSKLGKEPNVLVVVKQKNVKVLNETAKEINVEANLTVEIIDPKMVAPSFPSGLNNISMDENSGELKFEIEGSLSAAGSVEAVLSSKAFLGGRKTIAELKAAYPSERANIVNTSMVLNLNGLVTRDLKKKMQLDLKLTAPLSLPGEVLNAKKPKTEQMYENMKVKLN